MEVVKNYKGLRVIFTDTAFGRTGNLKTDIITMCNRSGFSAAVHDTREGNLIVDENANNALFGGFHANHMYIEIFLPEDKFEGVKQEIIEMASNKEDPIIFTTFEIEAYVPASLLPRL